MAEVHREIVSGDWRPPQKENEQGAELDFLSGFARRYLTERDLTARTREEYTKLLEGLIVPSLGEVQLRHLEPDQIRRWYSTVLSDDRPTQPKHAYALLRSILREAEDEGLIERNACRIRNAGRLRRTRDIELWRCPKGRLRRGIRSVWQAALGSRPPRQLTTRSVPSPSSPALIG